MLFVGLGLMLPLLAVEEGCSVLPPDGLSVGVLDQFAKAPALGVHERHRTVCGQPGDRFAGPVDCLLQATIGAVAPHCLDELCTRIVDVLGDDMQLVAGAASGHADIGGRSVQAVGEDGVRTRSGRALHTVGGRSVGKMGVFGYVLGGQSPLRRRVFNPKP